MRFLLRKSVHYSFLTLGLLLTIFLLAMRFNASKAEAANSHANSTAATPVGVVKVTRANLSSFLTLAAEFRPYQEIQVHAKVAGYVKEMLVDVGDRVNAGQLLATLEIPELKDDLQHATAATRHAQEELKRAEAELQRSRSAHENSHLISERLTNVLKLRPNLVAQQEIDDAQARDRVAEAQVSTDEASQAAAKEQLDESIANEEKIKTLLAYSRITAPFSGVITKRFADTGAMIQAGTASNTQAMPLVQLSENSRLRLVLPVPESVVPRIHIGEPVEVKVQALEKSFQGRISRFAQEVDLSTRTMETEVDVLNTNLILMPGMYASAVLKLDQRDGVLSLPVQAISGSDKNATVFLVNGEKRIEERRVRLGIETPASFEILSGLKENDLVIVGGRSALRTGQLVEPKIVAAADAKGES